MDVISSKLASILEEVEKKSEQRNVYLNLVWTGPCDNTSTSLQGNMPYEKVANVAIDMFCNTANMLRKCVIRFKHNTKYNMFRTRRKKKTIPWTSGHVFALIGGVSS